MQPQPTRPAAVPKPAIRTIRRHGDATGGDGEGQRRKRQPAGSLDNVRVVFWEAYRHLFPAHAMAAQTSGGNLVISWSVQDDPHARYSYAAPVMLRFDPALLEVMWKSEARGRMRIAQHHEPTLREGLRGYDPFTRFPNARVVCIG